MTAPEHRYSPADFVRALKDKKLGPDARTLTGFVKLEDNHPEAILFAPRGCGQWVPIPLDLIVEIVYLGDRPCRDHAHPYARLSIKTSNTVESALLGVLIASDADRGAQQRGGIGDPLPKACWDACYDCEHGDRYACDQCAECWNPGETRQAAPMLSMRRAMGRRSQRDDDACEKACSICRRFPWKTGPCWVCDNCGMWE